MPAWLSTSLARLAAWLGCASEFGHFHGPVDARWLPDHRRMQLLSEFRYTDPAGRIWIAPAGSVVDGSSIPRPFWGILGGPFEGAHRNASVLHDVECVRRTTPWREVHRLYYNAMRCAGVSEPNAKLMYFGVYHFGPRWPSKPITGPISFLTMTPEDTQFVLRRPEVPTDWDIDATRDYLDRERPSLTEIELMRVS